MVLALLIAGAVAAGVACGGGGGGDGPITESEASEATSRYMVTTLGLFTGTTEAQGFIDLFAPECREGVDPAALAFVAVFIQAFAPELRGIEIEDVDVGELRLEQVDEGTLVSPLDPEAIRVKVDGNFMPATEFFAVSGFEPSDDEDDLAEPVLLVRRNGDIYIGDCSELEGLSGGFN